MSGIWSDEDGGSTMIDNDTDTLFCAAEGLRNTTMITDPPTLDVVVRYVELIYYILLFVFGAPLNLIVLVLLVKYKKLRTLSLSLAFQVVFLDVCITLISIPTRIITTAANRWLFGEYICVILGAFNFMTYLMRILLMFMLVIDRFLTVFMPYKYPWFRYKLIWTISLILWVTIGFLCIILLPNIMDCYKYVPTIFQCNVSLKCDIICGTLLQIVNVVLVLPSIIIPTILYGVLFWKARKANRRAAPAANDSSERKATITFSLMFMALFATIIPLFIWFIFNFILSLTNINIPVPITTLSRVVTGNLLSVLVILDPIFIMRNRDVRDIISGINFLKYICCNVQ